MIIWGKTREHLTFIKYAICLLKCVAAFSIQLKWGHNQESGKAIILDQSNTTQRCTITCRVRTLVTGCTWDYIYKARIRVFLGKPRNIMSNGTILQHSVHLVDAISGSIYGQAGAIRRDDLGMSRPSTHNHPTRLYLRPSAWIQSLFLYWQASGTVSKTYRSASWWSNRYGDPNCYEIGTLSSQNRDPRRPFMKFNALVRGLIVHSPNKTKKVRIQTESTYFTWI